jgi:hypothetical protein
MAIETNPTAAPASVFLARRASWVVGVDLGQASDPTAIAVLEHVRGVLDPNSEIERHTGTGSLPQTVAERMNGRQYRSLLAFLACPPPPCWSPCAVGTQRGTANSPETSNPERALGSANAFKFRGAWRWWAVALAGRDLGRHVAAPRASRDRHGGNRKHRRAFYVAGEMRVERVMKDELVTILEAMRAAQSELAAYLVSTDRNAELTIAKLVGILDRQEVVRAMRLLRPLHRPGSAPERTLAEAS